MKKIILLFFLIALMNSCFSLNVENQELIISINRDGTASITERYYLSFAHSFDKSNFLNTAQQNSSSLSAWRADYDWFFTKITKTNNPQIIKSSIQVDEINNLLTLNYELNEFVSELIDSQPREETWKVNESIFQEFIEGGIIKIPGNEKIIIEVPFGAIIDRKELEQISLIEGNKITLSGITTNSIPLIYTIRKSISADVNPNLIEEILSNEFLLMLSIILLIILSSITYIKKNSIEKKIENYIVNHSEIEGKEAQEFELDLSK